MSDIKLSIGIITYNQENYLKQTLDSILSQEFDFDYEIVIGDDCSKDNTRNIIKEYAAIHKEIIPLYNENNLGIIKNYFNVINHCSGEYIMECAGDDWWLPGKVKTQITFMDNNQDIGMCYGKAKCFDENGISLNQEIGEKSTTIEELLICNNIPACTVCIRKSIFDQYKKNIVPETKNWLMEDYPAWLWISKNSNIKFLNEYFSAYRIQTESGSKSINVDKQIKFEECTWNIKKYFAEKYNIAIRKFDINEYRQSVLFDSLLKKYDIKTAQELKNNLKLNSIKNIIRYFVIMSEKRINLYKKIKSLI